MRLVYAIIAAMMALPATAQTQDQVNELVSRCIFDLTDAPQIMFQTDKRDGKIVIKFDRRMQLSKPQKDAVRNCVGQRLR